MVTRGVKLNGLIGREFRVGEVLLRGARPAEPRAHPAWLVGGEALRGLLYRIGLRAQVLTEGVLRTGDAVEGRSVPRRRIPCRDAPAASI